MSTQQHVRSIAEYKRYAFLKYCNKNCIRKNQLNELLSSNKLHELGLFCLWFNYTDNNIYFSIL